MSASPRYRVKEVFGPTLQGEGPHAGLPCLFVRLAGCNAWDGRPETRAASACPYCDTNFAGGDWLTLDELGARLARLERRPYFGCVLSGGEPLLQTDAALIAWLAERFAWVDIETNGTRPCPPRPPGVTVICSPKAIPGQPLVVEPDCWKILVPAQEAFLPQALASGRPVFVQPVCPDGGPRGPDYEAALDRCIALCLGHGCRLSLQLHKLCGLP